MFLVIIIFFKAVYIACRSFGCYAYEMSCDQLVHVTCEMRKENTVSVVNRQLQLYTNGTTHFPLSDLSHQTSRTGHFEPLCADSLSPLSALVVCRSMGFLSLLSFDTSPARGHHFISLQCNHATDTIEACTRVSHKKCSQKPKIECLSKEHYFYAVAPIRLENGFGKEGRLEIFHNGTWGTVCDERFTQAAAIVACRQLGHVSGRAVWHGAAYWGAGRGAIHATSITCTGAERSLSDCAIQWGAAHCNHYQDVGLICGIRQRAHERIQLRSYTYESGVHFF